MTDQKPPTFWRIPATVLTLFVATPLAPFVWMLLGGEQRKRFWESRPIRYGTVIAVAGSVPLLLVVIASTLGLLRDPNPNPVGFGILFFLSMVVGEVLILCGIFQTHYRARND